MVRWLVVLGIFVAPYLLLSFPVVPQALGRGIVVSIWLFGFPVAIAWFALKSQMIRPGGKLYQPQFDHVRPKIERNIRILVMAFGVFFAYVATLPFARDLTQLASGEAPIHVTSGVRRIESGYRNPVEKTIAFSEGGKNYYLWYPSKSLQVGRTYAFVVLPRSRIILDYHELSR
jgi:hypothetical protein